jgi:DNA-binding response OmpR family regulator
MYTILAVEDDAIVRTTLQRVLRSEGYDVALAPTAGAGLAECARLKPDAVVLDVHLPDGNGVDVCRAIKADPKLRHIPVLILTGDAVSLEDRTSGLDAGADDYILKPFEAQELLLRLKRLLTPARS